MAILDYFSYLAINQYAMKIAKWGTPEKSIQNAAKKC